MDEDYLSLTAGVWIPALQAIVTAAFWFVAVFALVAVANHLGVLSVPSWAVAAVAFALAGVYTWRVLLDDWRSALYGVEDTHQEPYHEPITTYQPQPVRVELASNNGRNVQLIDLPARPEQLQQLGAGLVEGFSFTEAVWVGSGGVFKRSEFVRLRDTMIRRGLAAWNSDHDTARGVRVTNKGLAVFRYVANSPTLVDYE